MENVKLFKKQTKMANTNLNKAKKAKNDEFYTQLSDIENELNHYTDQLKDKIVYCNCDNEDSAFITYFKTQPIKKLLHSSIQEGIDFRSPESIKMLEECDIVVTNPPFSLFREYIAQLVEYDKKFIIIGNKNAITYKEIFKLIKDNKLWLGYNSPGISEFIQLDGLIKKFGNINWFANVEVTTRNEDLILYKKYKKTDYPKYDNYNAINVDKVKDIPINYKGAMGVPITFLGKHNPEQFEILKCSAYSEPTHYGCGGLYVNGNKKYARILIKNKRVWEDGNWTKRNTY